MKEVDIYINETYYSDTKSGYYDAMLRFQGKELIFSQSFKDTKRHRLVLRGAIDAVKKLNQPCVITLYTTIPFGMNKIMNRDGEWKTEVGSSVNIDLLMMFKNLLESNEHRVKTIYDRELVESVVVTEMFKHGKTREAKEYETAIYDYYEPQTSGKIDDCIFCYFSLYGDVINESATCYAIYDIHPVSPGHVLIVSKRHVTSFLDLTTKEKEAMNLMLVWVKKMIDKQFHPDGYNVGFNIGEAAGQSVEHALIHLIPRYKGDVENPKGGVRGVIPSKQNYSESDESIINSTKIRNEEMRRPIPQNDTFKKKREEFRNAYNPWEEEDDTSLIMMYEKEERSIAQLSALFGRAPGAIESRLKKLGKLE